MNDPDRPLKILITNTVALNGGDAAILTALRQLLQEAFGEPLELIVYDSQPEIAYRYYPEFIFRELLYRRVTHTPVIDKVRSRRLRKYLRILAKHVHPLRFRIALRLWQCGLPGVAERLLRTEERRDLKHYREADLIVSTGGTYLTENYLLEPRLFDYTVSLGLGRPLVFFTQTLGPFSTPKYRRVLRRVFQEARLVLLRDEASRQNIRDLGAHTAHLHVRPDGVFALADPAVLDQAARRPVPAGDRLRVVVSVRHWPYFRQHTEAEGMERYKEAVRAVTEHLVNEHDAVVTFLSTCQGIPAYHYDDAAVASAIVQALPEAVRARVEVDRRFHHPLELRDQLSSYDWVLSTRMHMAILALIAGTPVLPISYEFKTKELFARLDMERWVHDIETVEGDALRGSVDTFIDALPALRSMLFPEKVEREYRQARETAALLNDAITSAG